MTWRALLIPTKPSTPEAPTLFLPKPIAAEV